MKRIIAVCFMLIGLSSFGETNAVPPKAHSFTNLEQQGQKKDAKPKTAGAPSGSTVYHRSEVPAEQLVMFHRIDREDLLIPDNNGRDLGTMLNRIFYSENNQSGNAEIRSAIITIFPSAR